MYTVWINYARTTLSKIQYTRACSVCHYVKYMALHLILINVFLSTFQNTKIGKLPF